MTAERCACREIIKRTLNGVSICVWFLPQSWIFSFQQTAEVVRTGVVNCACCLRRPGMICLLLI